MAYKAENYIFSLNFIDYLSLLLISLQNLMKMDNYNFSALVKLTILGKIHKNKKNKILGTYFVTSQNGSTKLILNAFFLRALK
jgi:hypothetical protein